jgi:putative Holliday junction resolvase
MRILGLDYGDVRVGVAVSDIMGWTAQGIESITYSGNEKKLIDRLELIIKEYQIEKIVIGFPINMNATLGPRAEKTEKFIDKLNKKLGLEVEKIDERLTTVSAQKTMTYLGINKEKKKGIVDTISAVFILQTYLDKVNKN